VTKSMISLRTRHLLQISGLYGTKANYGYPDMSVCNHEVPGSIPGSTVGIFSDGEDSRGDHGLGRLVQFRLKGPAGTTSSYITTHIIGTT